MRVLVSIVSSALSAAAGCMAAVPARADCFDEAAQAYRVSAPLLRAVARVESSMRPSAVNRSHLARTGTVDLGLMQVNSSWSKRLGLTEAELREPCTNVKVGAWILADALSRHGNTWEAVGAYNAACSQLKGEACRHARSTYAWRVYQHLASDAATQPPAVPRAVHAGLIAVSMTAATDGIASRSASLPESLQ